MALVILGRTRCAICGEVIESGQDTVAFSAFVPNSNDPLWIFHDAATHLSCFTQHPLAEEARQRFEELRAMTGPGHRTCRVCGREIESPDDYECLGHLTNHRASPLGSWNYAQFHRTCLRTWEERDLLLKQVEGLRSTGEWDAESLAHVLKALRGA